MDELGNRKDKIRAVERRLAELEEERKRLLADLVALQSPALSTEELPGLRGLPAVSIPPQSADEKVNLFLTLFRGQESVFPKLWENKAKGTKGYSPACRNEWQAGICKKPQTKCSDCLNQAFPPLDEQAVRDHLQGRSSALTVSMFRKRLAAYRKMEYQIEAETGTRADRMASRQEPLFFLNRANR